MLSVGVDEAARHRLESQNCAIVPEICAALLGSMIRELRGHRKLECVGFFCLVVLHIFDTQVGDKTLHEVQLALGALYTCLHGRYKENQLVVGLDIQLRIGDDCDYD
jgi:hypothetical protein